MGDRQRQAHDDDERGEDQRAHDSVAEHDGRDDAAEYALQNAFGMIFDAGRRWVHRTAATAQVRSVCILPASVQGEHGDEAGDLQEKVDEHGHEGVQGEDLNGRHGCQRAEDEGDGFTRSGEEDRRAHAADRRCQANFSRFELFALGLFEVLHDDEDVVHADGEHQERNDFEDDQRARNATVGEEADGAHHG